ncbi:MAG: FkbM family methyltransferase [Bacteroidales bacterium]|nr:FkbM family methyltransferase [Bacteroidales bacterium]
MKRLVKNLMPYGLYCFLQGKQNVQAGAYKFIIDTDCRLTGWMEPAHVKIELDPKEYIPQQIIKNGMYEKANIKKLYELLPQNGIFFDIGANIGIYSLNLCRKAEHVFAFEATKTTYDKLSKTVKNNEIKNIQLYLNAVDDKDDAEVEIFETLSEDNTYDIGRNSMHSGNVLANTVKTITLDTFVEQNNISKIDVIKIDIEGNELYALKGCMKSIKKYRPVILCEVSSELNIAAGYEPKELCNFFAKNLKYEAKILLNDRFYKIPMWMLKTLKMWRYSTSIFFFPL